MKQQIKHQMNKWKGDQKMKVKCDYCRADIEDTDEKCPHCGADNSHLKKLEMVFQKQ